MIEKISQDGQWLRRISGRMLILTIAVRAVCWIEQQIERLEGWLIDSAFAVQDDDE